MSNGKPLHIRNIFCRKIRILVTIRAACLKGKARALPITCAGFARLSPNKRGDSFIMWKRVFKISGIVLLGILAAGLLLFGALMLWTNDAQLNRDKLTSSAERMVVLDDADNQIYQFGGDLRSYAQIGDLPDHVKYAFIAVEDRNFYSHHGYDVKRILKAGWNNLRTFSYREGASTITQQLVKNTQLTPEKNILRKIREIRLSIELERNYTKDEILELYLNHIYFGRSAYGIESAAMSYFAKTAAELTPAESATLAGLIKSPSYYSPINHPDASRARRDLVLKLMRDQGYLEEQAYLEAIEAPIVCSSEQPNNYQNYLDAVLREAEELLGLSDKEIANGGFTIRTCFNERANTSARELLQNPEYYFGDYETSRSALLVCRNDNCGVQVFYGREIPSLIDFRTQVGSALKPLLVYAPAIERQLVTPITPILDDKTDFSGYSPRNYDGKYHGYVSVRDALANSYNVPAVKLLNSTGLDYSCGFVNRMGIDLHEKNLTAALGCTEQNIGLLSLLGGYATLANGGCYSKPHFISQITAKDGKTVYEYHHGNGTQVMGEDTAYLMTDMMKETAITGTASKLKNLKLPIAAKTGTVGTESGNQGAFHVSYTTAGTLLCYVGGDQLNNRVTGGSAPTLLARDFYKTYYENRPADFQRPESVVERTIDNEVLSSDQKIRLAAQGTPGKYTLTALFSSRSCPTEYSTYFTEPSMGDVKISIYEQAPSVTFTANRYFRYRIVRSDSEETLAEYRDKSGSITFVDKTALGGETYEYRILVESAVLPESDCKTYRTSRVIVPLPLVPDQFTPNANPLPENPDQTEDPQPVPQQPDSVDQPEPAPVVPPQDEDLGWWW